MERKEKAMAMNLSRKILVLVAAMLVGLVAVAVVARPGSAAIGSIPTGTPLHWYRIQTEGIVAGGTPFNQTGWLVVASRPITTAGTTNGTNDLDFLYIAGTNTATNPTAGSIEWATNSALHDLAHSSSQSARARLDSALVRCNGNSLSNLRCDVTVDDQVSLSDVQNNFNTSGGVTGDIYRIHSGSMQLQFSNGGSRITGQTNTLLGRGYLYGWGRYQATSITGTFVRTTRA
jgi:hypothetical protein